VKRRERTYFEQFWNDFAADGRKSVSEADRRFYTRKYAQPGAMRAGMEVFRAFTGSGHWLIDEAPGQVIPRLVTFFH
jgi:hypothetical protein